MTQRLVGLVMGLALLGACQETGVFEEDELRVVEIATEELPELSQEYIAVNFTGELVTRAFQVTNNSGLTFEAFLTNQVNLVFDESGRLEAFGEEGVVECDGHPRRHGRRRAPERGAERRSGEDKRTPPVEISADELPDAAALYVRENYGDSTILKILRGTNPEGETDYHVLVQNVGAVIFDADGNFLKLHERRFRDCPEFEELSVEDLSEDILNYLAENYADIEIEKARIGTIGEETHIHVLLTGVGVAIFNGSGEFLNLRECGMKRD